MSQHEPLHDFRTVTNECKDVGYDYTSHVVTQRLVAMATLAYYQRCIMVTFPISVHSLLSNRVSLYPQGWK